VQAERLRRLARSQFGVVSLQQLLGLAFSEQEVRTLVSCGHLRRVHRGVYAVGALERTEAGRYFAAVVAIGEGAALSHRSAAAFWEFLPMPRAHVEVSTMRAVRSRTVIRVHQVRGRLDAVRHRGMPITSPNRTLLDLAASPLPDEPLARAVHEAEVQRRTSVPSLLGYCAEAKGRPGVTRLRALITPGPAPTRNRFEDRLLRLLADHGLPHPVCNTHLHDAEVDFRWPKHGLVVEADGLRVHDTAYARARDRRKQATLEANGLRVLRVTWGQLTGEPGRTAERIRRALE
jgi:very-short-patch-repair endonuclease